MLDAPDVRPTSFNDVRRASQPFPQTTPEHLHTLAFLFGLDTPAPATARVLELGCAAGGNLVPFAMRHPQARALGVDVSSVQVAQGRVAIAQARLPNVALRTLGIADIDAALGKFDFIVCHRVYSRVSEPMQDAILRVCAENLTDEGVAYVSYNVYPGWKAREIVRDAMVLRGTSREAPDDKLSHARGILAFLAQAARPDSVLQQGARRNHAVRAQCRRSRSAARAPGAAQRPVLFQAVCGACRSPRPGVSGGRGAFDHVRPELRRENPGDAAA